MKKIALMCAVLGLTQAAPAWADGTLTAVLHSDITGFDPVFTTATVTQIHAYMIYDTLLDYDAEGNLRPQMVDTYTVSEDGKSFAFTLRDGLTFHDGTPVTAADVVASIRRWGAADDLGKQLLAVAEVRATGARSFEIVVTGEFGLVLHALAKNAPLGLFIMPEAVAQTPAAEQIESFVGSGPFRFVEAEWRPGEQIVYEAWDGYVPRQEPPSGVSGGKAPILDRVVFRNIADAQTAVSALEAGEIDYIENLPADLIDLVNSIDGLQARPVYSSADQQFLRPNTQTGAFADPKVRQAALYAIDQAEILSITSLPAISAPCRSLFPCGTPYANEAIAPEGMFQGDVDKAKALLAEAGYAGEPIRLLVAAEPWATPYGLVLKDQFQRVGMTVELITPDWQTVTTAREAKEGWEAFFTAGPSSVLADPAGHLTLSAACEDAWYGWPCDETLQSLQSQFSVTSDPAELQALADAMQARAFEYVTVMPLGQVATSGAIRTAVDLGQISTVPVFWTMSVAE